MFTIFRRKAPLFNSVAVACFAALTTGMASPAQATDWTVSNLKIYFTRAVGDYAGTAFDNTLEVHFTTLIVWPAGSPCTDTSRVYIDANYKHVVADAIMAQVTNRPVNINADDTLPIRAGACTLSYIDVFPN